MNGPDRGDFARADVAANANIAAVAGRTLPFLDRELFWVDKGTFLSVRRASGSVRAGCGAPSVSTPGLEGEHVNRARRRRRDVSAAGFLA
jgi:hypothetical protein